MFGEELRKLSLTSAEVLGVGLACWGWVRLRGALRNASVVRPAGATCPQVTLSLGILEQGEKGDENRYL